MSVHSVDPLDAWLRDSIGRGCTLESMVESMIASGHAENLALLIVSAAFARFKPEALDLAQDGSSGEKILRVFANTSATNTAAQPISPALEMPPSTAGGFLDPVEIAGNAIALSDRDIKVVMVCTAPRIALFDDVLSDAECDALIAASRSRLQRSKVVANRGSGEFVDDTRTSYGAYFNKGENSLVATIQRRIAELTRWPLTHAEPLQILNYGLGGEYLPHFDYFEPQQPGLPSPLESGGQRIATVVMYLNDVEAGGGTIFPHLNLETRPRKGGAIYFSYQLAVARSIRSRCMAARRIARRKWIATQWFRDALWVAAAG
ncbi:prolyl 4-hydroxylase alpha subunit, putative [Ricinus communis]|uniref:Prolyl 4-hydroxylase alpha subunit, putative n=1 Tax=Ricinus communis TaxID=3988 RepID=B9TKB7_RICCO|nr:prolyl 4-hydroxylase alpha subunit, putative [Ricinus communis]